MPWPPADTTKEQYFLHAPEYGIVWIEVNGIPLQVHKPTDVYNNITTGYIEAENGAIFTIHWILTRTSEKREKPFLIEASADGRHIDGAVYGPKLGQHDKDDPYRTHYFAARRIDAGTVQRMFFTTPVWSSESVPQNDAVGTIDIEFRTLRRMDDPPPKCKQKAQEDISEVMKLSDNKQATITSVVGYCEREEVEKKYLFCPKHTGGPPFMTFRFYYRSRRYLEVHEIIPSSDGAEALVRARKLIKELEEILGPAEVDVKTIEVLKEKLKQGRGSLSDGRITPHLEGNQLVILD